ncbi:DNA replication endonuclease-helicase Dna2 [Cryptotrichosporon argae]
MSRAPNQPAALPKRSFAKTVSKEWAGQPPGKRTRPSSPKTPASLSRATSTVCSEVKTEDDFMADLFAGIDASVFATFDLSPAQRRKGASQVKVESPSPSKHVKVEALAPVAVNVPGPSRPLAQSQERKSPVKRALAFGRPSGPRRSSPVKPFAPAHSHAAHEISAPAAPSHDDDEDFAFDFDISELAHLDDAELLRPPPPAPKTLVVADTATKEKRVVHLKQRWAELPVRPGDIVNVISPSLKSPIELSFKTRAFIVTHPDVLLTMTSIATSMPCPRRPLLNALLKPPGAVNKFMLYGTIQHALLQTALLGQDFSQATTEKTIDEELSKEGVKMDVWGAGLDGDEVREELLVRAGEGFATFGEKWVGETPTGELYTAPGECDAKLAISGLHDVEEDIWSPKWGLKGKVDASVQARVVLDQKTGQVEEHVAPLEIKTGRSVGVLAHRAQTMLYTLLMEDRYGVPVPAGLLYYSQLDKILRVEAKLHEIRALVIARNELAEFLSKNREVGHEYSRSTTRAPVAGLTNLGPAGNSQESSTPDDGTVEVEAIEDTFLPPTIDNMRECKGCFAVDTCMLYRKAVDQVPVDSSDELAELYIDKTAHLSEADAAFFRKWEGLLTVEEQDIGRFRSQLWTMTAEQREKTGRCFADMVVESYSNDIGKSIAKIHRHTYTFIRAPAVAATLDTATPPRAGSTSLLSGHITKGDPVSLSVEPDLLCLSRGYVLELTERTVTVGVQYEVKIDELLRRSRKGHSHRVLPNIDSSASLEDAQAGIGSTGRVVFRIDKDEMVSAFARMRTNLGSLFFANGDSKLRRLVVGLDAPRFDPARVSCESSLRTAAQLNYDQRAAMAAVLATQDYALILGMPGTGKTTTIAEIIKTLVARGKTVLLSSYTHSAVDSILTKLLGADFGMLRLGNIDKVHQDVQHLTLEVMGKSSSTAQLDERLMRPPVVAATCLSVEHPLFLRRKFDYCIVDEASQITLPTCLGPLRMADKFVLVGDHYQLPPIVRNPKARAGGLDTSLFKVLCTAHPAAVTDLAHQYRMNEDIMALSNRFIYEGRLKCGSEQVARQSLVLPHRKTCDEVFGQCGGQDRLGACWVQGLMDEDVKAVFVDTDDVPARDSRIGSLVQNEGEARLVYQLATALAASGIRQQDMAVITPYRQQIKLLSFLFAAPLPKVEILTADKSQGRDKDVVLISLVRSNEGGNIGDLLRDWRRINVSFTRAKKKLVVFGSRRTLDADPLLAAFLGLMRERGWIRTLPRGADRAHGCIGGAENPASGKKAGDTRAPRATVGERVLGAAVVVEALVLITSELQRDLG